jgi:hypothetical protein
MSNPAIYRWGFQATVSPQDQPNVLSYLKLLLQYPSGIVPNLSGGQTSSPAAKTAAILLRIETSPERAVSDFLAGLRGPIDAALAEVFGAQTVAASTVRYVFTVSPNWDDPAKAHLIAAIEAAGYGTHRVDFNLVGDTDAAAAIALKQSHGVLQV